MPKPDADGLDQGGIALPEVLVPLGTRTGFNTRNDTAGFPWATGRWDGSFCQQAARDAKAGRDRCLGHWPSPSRSSRRIGGDDLSGSGGAI